MTTIVITAVLSVIAKTLLPMPPIDDRVRAVWAWAWKKVAG